MKLISVIVPVYNEEKYILRCLNSILTFEIPQKTEVEILIVDGLSNDKTLEIISLNFSKVNNIRILQNSKKIQSSALNIGITNAKGDYIVRLDAHSIYPKDYLTKLDQTIHRVNADNVGGVIKSMAADASYNAAFVQALTTHWFGVGNSKFRTGAPEGYVDTVPFGYFKKELFSKIGLFDERLERAQDYEFNCRIIRNGGKIWLNPEVVVSYYNQPTFFKFLKKQIILDAPYNAYMWYIAPQTLSLRHAITAIFAMGIIVGLALSFVSPLLKISFLTVLLIYFLLAIAASISQGIKYNNRFHFVLLPFGFLLYHFMHGIGVLYGLIKIILKKSPVQTFIG